MISAIIPQISHGACSCTDGYLLKQVADDSITSQDVDTMEFRVWSKLNFFNVQTAYDFAGFYSCMSPFELHSTRNLQAPCCTFSSGRFRFRTVQCCLSVVDWHQLPVRCAQSYGLPVRLRLRGPFKLIGSRAVEHRPGCSATNIVRNACQNCSRDSVAHCPVSIPYVQQICVSVWLESQRRACQPAVGSAWFRASRVSGNFNFYPC